MYKYSVLTVAIALIVLIVPVLTMAQTTSTAASISSTASTGSVQTQIQSLLARFQALELELSTLLSHSTGSSTGIASSGTSGNSSSALCYMFKRSLSRGSRGSDVSALQNYLLSHGVSISDGPTGYFGMQTKLALTEWQEKNNIAVKTDSGSGIFGPRSGAAFNRSCTAGETATSTPSAVSFSADPASGGAPLAVIFTASAPISSGSSTYLVDFGDQSTATAMTPGACIAITSVVGGQGGIRCSASLAHTYQTSGNYTARLMRDTCPAGAQCFVGPQTVATTLVTVSGGTTTGTSTATTTKDIVQISAPGTATLAVGGTVEIRNKDAYFMLVGLTATTATIQVTPVGCWNSFPSDIMPEIHCMIYAMPIPLKTLSVGESYTSGQSFNSDMYTISLSGISSNKATFTTSSIVAQ